MTARFVSRTRRELLLSAHPLLTPTVSHTHVRDLIAEHEGKHLLPFPTTLLVFRCSPLLVIQVPLKVEPAIIILIQSRWYHPHHPHRQPMNSTMELADTKRGRQMQRRAR